MPNTLYVSLSGNDSTGNRISGSPYKTIQAAINAAQSGDTVLIGDGTFSGAGNNSLSLVGKTLSILSQNGPDKTIIDAGRSRLFTISSNATVGGISFTNGYVSYGGDWSSDSLFKVNNNAEVLVQNCKFTGNQTVATYVTSNLQLINAEDAKKLTLSNVLISNNTIGGGGWTPYAGGSAYVVLGKVDMNQTSVINNTITSSGSWYPYNTGIIRTIQLSEGSSITNSCIYNNTSSRVPSWNGIAVADVSVGDKSMNGTNLGVGSVSNSDISGIIFASNKTSIGTGVPNNHSNYGYQTLVSSVISGTAGNDTLLGSTGADSINGLAGNDSLVGLSGNDSLTGGDGSDVLDGGTGVDTMVGGLGNDTFGVDNQNDVVIENAGEGADLIQSSVTYTVSANVENLSLTGGDATNAYGNGLDNVIWGNDAANRIESGGGSDTLNGGAGADTLLGGAGNDLYIVDSSGDLVVENPGEGTDQVNSSVAYTLTGNVENLALVGSLDISGTGNALANSITGNSGNNLLDGGTGVDTMVGGSGNDTYVVADNSEVLIENAGQGSDEVRSAISWTLGANLENLVLTGETSVNGVGNDLNNSITGNTGNNLLDGGAGDDVLTGGGGSDTLVGGAGNDTLYATGRTTIAQSLSLDVTADIDHEDYLEISPLGIRWNHSAGNRPGTQDGSGYVATNINGTDWYATWADGVAISRNSGFSNYDPNWTTGQYFTGEVSVVQTGGRGGVNVAQQPTAENGYTTRIFLSDYYGGSDWHSIHIVESGGAGNQLTFNLGSSLSGGAGADYLIGSEGDDIMDGGTENDTLIGGGGNDTLLGGDGNDSLVATTGSVDGKGFQSTYQVISGNFTWDQAKADAEARGGHLATVGSEAEWNTIKYVLPEGRNLWLGGNDVKTEGVWKWVDGTPWSFSNWQQGEPNNEGGTEDYLMLYGNAPRTWNDGNTWGVQSYVLETESTSSSQSAASLLGGAGNDTIKGGGGNDTLSGGDGNDLIIAGQGVDKSNYQIIRGSWTWENAKADAEAKGGHLAVITSQNEQDAIYKLIQNQPNSDVQVDILIGGSKKQDGTWSWVNGENWNYANWAPGEPNNSYIDGENYISLIPRYNGQWNDVPYGSASSYGGGYLPAAYLLEIEPKNYASSLEGGNGSDTIQGAGGSDTLDGGNGVDSLAGGAGDDLYVIDSSSDVIVENAGEGSDLVRSSASYVLSANIENLLLTGSGSINGTGNDLANSITGNDGNNLLDGGAGEDTLIGGAGNDTYIIDSAGDVVREAVDAGTDAVQSSLSYTLSANVENLSLSGAAMINGRGNDLDNQIVGNAASNLLEGAEGSDTLLGGGGNDTLYGYWGNDVLEGGEGNDSLESGTGYDTLSGGAGNDTLNGWDNADQMSGGAGNDLYFVDDVGDVVVESSNEGLDAVISSVNFTLAANVENLVLSGSENINGTGNELANSINGNSGNNQLLGGEGNDTLVTGTGVDVVSGGTGVDRMIVDWRSVSGAVITRNVTKVGSGADASFNGTFTAKDNLGNVLSQVSFDGVEQLNFNGSDVDLNTYTASPGVTIRRTSTSSSTTEQGGQVTYSVVLNKAPQDASKTVSINFVSSDLTEGSVLTPKLTFKSTNWDTPQTLTIQGVDDYENDGNISYNVTGTVETNDLSYNRITIPTISLINNDDGQDAPLYLIGTQDADVLDGRNGNDKIYGGYNQDEIHGGRGDDKLYGEQDDDHLFGDAGNDQLYGGYDDDTLDGGVGNDQLYGEQGVDTLLGGDGNDVIDGGLGADSMVGGIGNDTYYVDNTGDVINDQGNISDVDTVIVTQTISYTLASNIENAAVNAAGDANLTGNALNNNLTGNDGANILDGATGNDVIDGGSGNDVIYGGDGLDLLFGGAGNDVVNAGSGDDIIANGDGRGNDTYDGGQGVDFMRYGSAFNSITVVLGDGQTAGTASGTDIGIDLLFNIENITGGAGADNITGNSVANEIDGGSGNDVIDAGSGNDVIYGGDGLDLLFGGAGNDVVNAGSGDDIIANGDGRGNDTYDGGQGVDFMRYGSAFNTITVALADGQTAGTASGTDIGIDLIFNIENVIGGVGADNITGNSARNIIDGGAGNDVVCGTQRVLNGGRGQVDTLTGGTGADVFVIGGGVGRFYDDGAIGAGRNDYALVTDFTVGQDRLQLKGTASQYFMGSTGINGVSGSGVYFDSNNSRTLDTNDELLAILRSGNSTVLNAANAINTANFV